MMSEQETRQVIKPAGISGKQFFFSVVLILAELAIGQLVFNLLISLTGIGLLNILFYIFAVWLLLSFMHSTVAGNTYQLNADCLVLERHFGDSTVSVVSIPKESVLSIRPAYCAENLHVSYAQVTYIRKAVQPSLRMKLAFCVAPFSASRAKEIAGSEAERQKGYVVAFTEGQKTRACVFDPDERMIAALREAFGDRMDWDDRLARPQADSLLGRSLQRAFTERYPNVRPLVSQEDEIWETGQKVIREEKKQAALKARMEREAFAAEAVQKKKKAGLKKKKRDGRNTEEHDEPN